MTGAFYHRHLSEHYGIEVVPASRTTQATIDGLIVHELACATVSQALSSDCLARLDAAVAELADMGCTAVLLACTDFGMLYDQADAPMFQRALPLYDTAVLHAQAAIELALAGR